MKRLILFLAIIIGSFCVPEFSTTPCYAQTSSTFTKKFYGAWGGKKVTLQLTLPKQRSKLMQVSGYYWYGDNKNAKVRVAGNLTNTGFMILYKYADRNSSKKGDTWMLPLDFDEEYAYLEGQMENAKGQVFEVFLVSNM